MPNLTGDLNSEHILVGQGSWSIWPFTEVGKVFQKLLLDEESSCGDGW